MPLAFALTPEQRIYRAEVADRMHVARLKLAAAHHEAAALAADVAGHAQAEIDRQSPRWRQSRTGRAAQAWADQWRTFNPDQAGGDAVAAFQSLPDAAGH